MHLFRESGNIISHPPKHHNVSPPPPSPPARAPVNILTDPGANLHFYAPTYLLVSNSASTAAFTFLAFFFLGLTTGCVVPRLTERYRGEDVTIGTGFWVCSTISLLVNGWTSARLKGMFVHEVTA